MLTNVTQQMLLRIKLLSFHWTQNILLFVFLATLFNMEVNTVFYGQV